MNRKRQLVLSMSGNRISALTEMLTFRLELANGPVFLLRFGLGYFANDWRCRAARAVSGEEATMSVGLRERCYARRAPTRPWHLLDCTDRIEIGRLSTIAGYRSIIITHGIDYVNSRQICRPIKIGDFCYRFKCNCPNGHKNSR
jgi:hypothetical protein